MLNTGSVWYILLTVFSLINLIRSSFLLTDLLSMNPLNWLPFYNEEKQGEHFDGSLLLPLTVGLVSVVSSVLVGYRSGLLTRKQAASLIVKQVEQAERSANASSREMTKRKPASKSAYKPNTTATDPVASSPSAVDVTPIMEKAPPSKSQNKQTDDHKLHSAYQISPQPAHTVQPQKSEAQDNVTGDTIVDSTAPKPTSAPSKRNKKSKHSRHTRSEPEPPSSNSVNSTEQDIAWVVVTSKKLKQSVSGDQASSKVSKKKNKLSESKWVSWSFNENFFMVIFLSIIYFLLFLFLCDYLLQEDVSDYDRPCVAICIEAGTAKSSCCASRVLRKPIKGLSDPCPP